MSVVAFARILSCCALVTGGSAMAQPAMPAMTQPKIQAEPAPKTCIDQMEVEPGFDDDPMFVDDLIETGCTVDSDPIAI